MFHVKHPTLRDWTHAHAEPDTQRRLRAIHFLHDRARASRMGPLKAWLYLHRHGFGFVLLLALIGGYGWVCGWLGAPVVCMLVGTLLGWGLRRG